MSKNILVMGAGSWGTALAIHLAKQQHNIKLWAHRADHAHLMLQDHENSQFLPGITFPKPLKVVVDFKDHIKSADIILIGVPSHAFNQILTKISPYISKQGILWATKGLCHHSNRFLHEVAKEILPDNTPIGLITGPSFAREVAEGLPTAVAIASPNKSFAVEMQSLFNSETFRTYITSDILGAQIGGAVKNALAIATGISDGLGFGANARTGLITRGFAEMTRLGLALGASEKTLMGLTGLGDLILTCTDNQSRNRRYGLALGKGMDSESATKDIGQVVEGITSTTSVLNLAQIHKIEMPIIEQIYAVLHKSLPAHEAVKKLMSRTAKSEF